MRIYLSLSVVDFFDELVSRIGGIFRHDKGKYKGWYVSTMGKRLPIEYKKINNLNLYSIVSDNFEQNFDEDEVKILKNKIQDKTKIKYALPNDMKQQILGKAFSVERDGKNLVIMYQDNVEKH